MNLNYKIKCIGLPKYDNRIKVLSVFRKKYNSYCDFNISYTETKELYDNIELYRKDETFEFLSEVPYYLFDAINEIYHDVDYEILGEEYIMDLGSSKYQMIEAQELEKEANEWFKTLTDREKEYISYFQSQFIATAQ